MIKNVKNERGLTNLFYIVDCSKGNNSDWWQLRLKESHFVVSAVHTKAHVLECLYNVCMRYKTHKRLMKVLKHCEFKSSRESIEQAQKEYVKIGHLHEDKVEEVVTRAMSDIKNGVNRKKPMKKVINTSSLEGVSTKEVISSPPPASPSGLGKKLPKKRIGLISID